MKEIRLSAAGASILLSAEIDESADNLVAIDCEADGFKGHARERLVGADWFGFFGAMETLHNCRTGEAVLESAMSGEFSL